jgi:F-type H+-transporting ATPase subunit b
MGLQHVLSIEPGSVLWTIITFLAVVWLIGKFGWKPILAGLKSREETIRRDLETARAEREKAAAMLTEYQTALAGARKESTDILQRAQDSAAAIVEDARAKSREESQHEVERARAEIERLAEAAKTELRTHVAELTALATSRLIGQAVDPRRHEQLILEALKEDR